MTLVSLSLLISWMTLSILGISLSGLVHVLFVAAVVVVFVTDGPLRRRRNVTAPPTLPIRP